MRRIATRTVIGALLLGGFAVIGARTARELAADRYQRAQTLLEDLDVVPQVELGQRQYLLVIDALKSVHRASPASSYCDDALLAVGDVYTAMIDRFGPDPWRDKAIGAYKYVIHEYPHSPLLDKARDAIRALEGGAIPAAVSKARTPAEPEPPPADEGPVPAAPARPAPADAIVRQVSVTNPPAALENRAGPTPDAMNGGVATISAIRHYSHPDFTRVVIDTDDYTPYKFDFLSRPRRLYFDLLSARMLGAMRHGVTIEVGDAQVARIRAAQNRMNKARVVLDLKDDVYYDISWLSNPPRLVIDLRGHSAVRQTLANASAPASPAPAKLDALPSEPAPEEPESFDESFRKLTAGRRFEEPAARALDASGEPAPSPRAERAETIQASALPRVASEKLPPPKPKSFEEAFRALMADRKFEQPAARPLDPGDDPAPSPRVEHAEIEPSALPRVASSAPPPREPEVTLAKATAPPAPVRNLPANLAPPKPAEATSRGNQSLIRALGLKIGRVVIDAGHGGHDTGMIGPTGLREKDVVLDVSLRLGKLIEQRLGAEVIYTRQDDRFLDLRDRPKVANDTKADLFVSVHANAYKSASVRGVETFYLNFTADPWALKVASRENAASTHSVHELQDLLGKIALKEKMDESREFATRMQSAVYTGLSKHTSGLKNRGARQAPLIVLIGAKMPAILTEIGFLSNPTDEKLFKSGKYRDTVAEQLFSGIESYVKSLSAHTLTMTDTESASASLD